MSTVEEKLTTKLRSFSYVYVGVSSVPPGNHVKQVSGISKQTEAVVIENRRRYKSTEVVCFKDGKECTHSNGKNYFCDKRVLNYPQEEYFIISSRNGNQVHLTAEEAITAERYLIYFFSILRADKLLNIQCGGEGVTTTYNFVYVKFYTHSQQLEAYKRCIKSNQEKYNCYWVPPPSFLACILKNKS